MTSPTAEKARLAEADAGVRPWHGDSRKGLGASHQTGWTGLVVDLVLRRPASG